MAVESYEISTSRPLDGQSSERRFVVKGTLDEAAAKAELISVAPATVGTLTLDLLSSGVEPVEGTDWWLGTARYGKQEKQQRQTGDSSFSFDTSGGNQHITQSLATVTRYATAGTATDYKGAIGVTEDSVEGVDIETSDFNFQVTAYVAAAAMTSNYVAMLKQLTKRVNSVEWSVYVDGVTLTFPKGSVRLNNVAGSKRLSQGDWQLTFSFTAKEPLSQTVNGMAVVAEGWQYVWYRYVESADTTSKRITRLPVEAIVERVYEYGDFGALALPESE